MYKSRSLPHNMGYKECQILVVATYDYYGGRKTVGQSVAHIWKMCRVLESAILHTLTVNECVDTIIQFQETQELG